jgi:hypothetical protein
MNSQWDQWSPYWWRTVAAAAPLPKPMSLLGQFLTGAGMAQAI